jgi:hypothetical protein
MLDLDDVRWGELHHSYGAASDTPILLRMLETNPDVQKFSGPINAIPEGLPDAGRWNPLHYSHYGSSDAEPWQSLWMSICHQGSVYTSSYAAVPHIVRIAALAADPPALDYLLLPAMIERGRHWPQEAPLPSELAASYFEAIRQLPVLIPRLAKTAWDEWSALTIAGALLIVCGQRELGEGISSMSLNSIRLCLEFRTELEQMADIKTWKGFTGEDLPAFDDGEFS